MIVRYLPVKKHARVYVGAYTCGTQRITASKNNVEIPYIKRIPKSYQNQERSGAGGTHFFCMQLF